MNGEALDISALVAISGLILTLIALTGGVLYRLGKLSSRVDHLDRRFDRVIEETAETREENRRNHQQLLQALAHHSHDPAAGFAILRIPPGTENPAG